MVQIKQLKDFLLYFLGIIVLIYSVYTIFYENEKWHLVLFSLVIYGFFLLLFKLISKKKIDKFYAVLIFFVFYIFILAVFFSSSFLQIKEFQFTHPKWVKVDQVEIKQIQIHYLDERRSLGYASTELHLKYQFNKQIKETVISGLYPQYLLYPFEDSESLKEKALSKTNNAIVQHQYRLYVNPYDTDETRFFLNQEYFDLRNAGFAWLIYVIQALLLFFIFLVVYLIVDAVWSNNRFEKRKNNKKIK